MCVCSQDKPLALASLFWCVVAMVVFLVETTNGPELDIAVDMNETMCELLNRIGDEQPDRLMFLVPWLLFIK